MKKLGLLIAVFGVFALVGVASAATADELQPAATITYNEDLTVNGTGRFDSAYIGSTEAGVGGVTFFNGTIVNNSVDDDGESTIPVTFGDDVRIDGSIYRTEAGGDNAIRVADSIVPQRDNHYELGTSGLQWTRIYAGDGYFSSTVTAEALTLTGTLTGITATFSNDITAQGDINQDLADHGAVKALVRTAENGQCGRQWTYNNSAVTCAVTGIGVYTIDFDFNVSDRYWQVTSMDSSASRTFAEAYVSGNNQISVNIYADSAGSTYAPFILTVY